MCGDGITTPEVLTSDLNCGSFSGLRIQGPGGRLDMRGFTLSCEGAGGQGITLEGSGALLQNGTVADCGRGLFLDGSDHRVNRIISRNNNSEAVFLNGTGNRVTQTTARDSASGFFISPDGDNVLSRNRATNNRNIGFFALGAGTTYIGNVTTGNANYGFFIDGSNNLLRQNVAQANGGGFPGEGFAVRSENKAHAQFRPQQLRRRDQCHRHKQHAYGQQCIAERQR